MTTYYKTLGVDVDAEPEVIQFAYKALSRKYHPDVCTHPDAEEKMKRINLAYETLSDPCRRAAYDAETRARAPHHEPGTATRSSPAPSPGPASSPGAAQDIMRLAATLASRAKYGYRGEKPLAILAMLATMRSSAITDLNALTLLDTHRDSVRAHFLTLARAHGQVKDAGSSWSVITSDKTRELQRAIEADPAAGMAFAKLGRLEIDTLIEWFHSML